MRSPRTAPRPSVVDLPASREIGLGRGQRRPRPSNHAADMAVCFRHPRACVGGGLSCGPPRHVGASRRHGTPAFRGRAAKHRSVGFKCRAVAERLHHLGVKPSVSTLYVRNGVGAVGAQTHPPATISPRRAPNSRAVPAMGKSTWVLKLVLEAPGNSQGAPQGSNFPTVRSRFPRPNVSASLLRRRLPPRRPACVRRRR
ncbi:hypothetical protein TcYC6_0004590 [Trypanosoma cruzi]|nr:hypothetical protein TcYC6_0004590 [Trypanosoma cruzi]